MAKQKTLAERRQEAQTLVREISEQLNKAEDTANQCRIALREAISSKKEFAKLVPAMNRMESSANSAIVKLRHERDRLKNVLSTVNNFYTKTYIPLAEKIKNKETGLNAQLKQGSQFNRDVKKARTSFEKEATKIKTLVSESRNRLNELKRIESALRTIQKKITSHDVSIDNLRTKIEESIIKVTASTKSILSSEKTILNKENQKISLHKKSDNAYSEIKFWHDQAKSTIDLIKNIYEIAANTGLGGEFDKRKKILDVEIVKWQNQLIGTTIILFGFILGLFILQLSPESVDWDVSKLKFDANFYIRFLITSPIIFYLIFVTGQYNRAKKLLERYSFKTAIALSIDAHINLLSNIKILNQKENYERVVNFIIDGFTKIYQEPYLKEEGKDPKGQVSEILNILKSLKPNL